ncbi:MAG: hypothetical protein JXX29_23495 [Deltaproteobacteria bacterium]|nr:hypothetical protein [Deltaproteobacteria bacterium]MBN2674666.1 hypothetical protein [Deltaproteobacteria bacterium]
MKSKNITLPILLYVVLAFVSGCQGCGVSIPDSPDGTVAVVATQLEKGNPQIVWQALPKTYQSDINGLVQQFAGKMDPELWDKGFAVAGKLTEVAKEKKEFILASPMVGQLQVKKEDLAKHWDSVVALLEVLVKSELSSLDDLKKFDGGSFLSGTGKDLFEKGKELKTLAPEDAPKSFADMKVEKVNEKENSAMLKITFDGKTESLEMAKVEERWIPKDIAGDWKDIIAEAKKGIDEISGEQMTKSKPQILMMIAGIDAGLDQLKNAKTQAEFDAVVQGILMGGLMH